jgi:hypothetical protein
MTWANVSSINCRSFHKDSFMAYRQESLQQQQQQRTNYNHQHERKNDDYHGGPTSTTFRPDPGINSSRQSKL